MRKTADVLILGGGLAGLSTAYHLGRVRTGLRSLVIESKPRPGGLAGSLFQDGFTFDHTGHLLHLHDPYGKKLVLSLLRGNVAVHERSSWIYSRGTYTRYPFQANTFGLPRRIVEDCVVGFLKTVHRPRPVAPDLSFREWCLRTFGGGISRHFMFPYNRKLWNISLSRMTADWQGRFIPKPAPEEVLYGALADQKKFFGYNAAFRYPVRGGTQALSDALSGRVSGLKLGCRVMGVDLREKVAVIEGLGEVGYERLVNTLPLAHFLDLVEALPSPMLAARRLLRYNAVYNLNLGIGRSKLSDKHWIYFPESRYPFYRVGFPSNFSPFVGPRGTSSMYVEVSRHAGAKVDLDVLERSVLSGLKSCGILRSSDRLLTRLWNPIPCAYVVHDFNRARAVAAILAYLRSMGVESIGRYGAWKYSFMEETILDGKRCAERLSGRVPAAPETREHAELRPLR